MEKCDHGTKIAQKRRERERERERAAVDNLKKRGERRRKDLEA